MRIEERVIEEKERIIGILSAAGVTDDKMDLLDPVIENTAWMKAKLDDSRQLIRRTDIVVPYDNGGGQKGIRENPAFRGYEALFKSYMSGMNRIIDSMPEGTIVPRGIIDDEIRPKTVLSIVKARHSKEA